MNPELIEYLGHCKFWAGFFAWSISFSLASIALSLYSINQKMKDQNK